MSVINEIIHRLVSQIGEENVIYLLEDIESDMEMGRYDDFKSESGTALTYPRPEIKPDDFKPLRNLGKDKDESFKQTPYDKDMGEPFEPVKEVIEGEDKSESHCFDSVKKELQENELIELNDILDEGKPEDLIKENIEYILKERGVYDSAKEKGEDIKVSVTISDISDGGSGTDSLVGHFTASNSYEEFTGVFMADGYMNDNILHLISLTIGDSKYFNE